MSLARKTAVLALAGALCFLTACSPKCLQDTKALYNAGEYAKTAAKDCPCEAADAGCNQFHLLKGNACYALAKKEIDAQKNYVCAVGELSAGIGMTKQWTDDGFALNRAGNYENLCEALRNLQDREKGATAENYTRTLLATALKFLDQEPGSIAARYYVESARLTLLRSCLLAPDQCPDLCGQLNGSAGRLDQAAPRAAGTAFEQQYHRLRMDLNGAKRAVPGCN